MEAKYKIGDVLSTSTTIEGAVCCGPTPNSGVATTHKGHAFKEAKVDNIYFNEKENNFWYRFNRNGNYYEEKGLEPIVIQVYSSKGQMLIEEAKRRYKSGDNVKSLSWPAEGAAWGPGGKSDRHYKTTFRDVYYTSSDNPFWYDEEGDTLTNWGSGLGLLYHKGRWAGEKEISYQIY